MEQVTDKSKIIEKVQKMLRLQKSAEELGSVEEANAAAMAVQRVLLSYNLTLMDIPTEERKEKMKIEEGETLSYYDTYGTVWTRNLAAILCNHNFCKLLKLNNGHDDMRILGLQENVVAVGELYKYLAPAFRKLAIKAFQAHYENRWGKDWRDGCSASYARRLRDEYMKSFLMGCTRGLDAQLTEIDRRAKAEVPGTSALVVCHEAAFQDYFKDKHIKTTTLRGGDYHNVSASDAGYQAGRNISLNKQVSGASDTNLIR